MKNRQALQTIKWLKRIAATVTIAIWLYVIIYFIQDPAPFRELVPYCMGSTMLIFGILTGIFKGLEYWESNIEQKETR